MAKHPETEQHHQELVTALGQFTKAILGVQNGLTSSLGALRAGVDTRPLTNNGRVTTGGGLLAGYAFRETSGTAGAVIRILDGSEPANGNLLVPISLSAGESTRDWYLPSAIGYINGIYVQVVSGAVEGVVFLAPPT